MDMTNHSDHNPAVIKFGTYTHDYSKRPEPIEWYIIKSNGGCAKLLSKYILDLQQFDSWNTGFSWQRTRLADWLNYQFTEISFTEEEQDAICTASDLEDIGLKEPTDKLFINVFLLDKNELCDLPSDVRRAQTTKACASKITKPEEEHWWTRNYDINSHSLLTVNQFGHIDEKPALSNEYRGVRPVVWIDLMKLLLASNVNVLVTKEHCEPYSNLL